MNKKDQMSLVADMQQEEVAILSTKGSDYADEDVLKNFKQVAQICSILNIDARTIYGTHLFYIIIKVQRICNLLNSGKTAKHESVRDSIIDLRNYISLMNCSLEEEAVKQLLEIVER